MSSPEMNRSGHDHRPLTIMPDTNVLIHGRALQELDWDAFERPVIDVVLVAPTIRELDKLKNQPGRANRQARQISSDLRKMPGADPVPLNVRAKGVTVSKRVVTDGVYEPLHPALRLDHADQALINYGLHLKAQGLDVLLLTDDFICSAHAGEVGLPAKLIPDEWLREPEDDEGAKENRKLKAEIARLKATEPQISLEWRDEGGACLTKLDISVAQWPALTPEQIEQLMGEVNRLCPPATSFEREGETPAGHPPRVGTMPRRGAITRPERWIPPSDFDIDRYRSVDYPRWRENIRSILETIHERLEARSVWPTVEVHAANTGTRPATGVLLSVEAKGDLSVQNPAPRTAEDFMDFTPALLQPPPEPPRGRMQPTVIDALQFLEPYREPEPPVPDIMFRNSVDPDERLPDAFYWREGKPDWRKRVQAECQSWRHGHEPNRLPIAVSPAVRHTISGALEVAVHADNLSTPVVARLPVTFNFEAEETYEEVQAMVALLGRHAARFNRL